MGGVEALAGNRSDFIDLILQVMGMSEHAQTTKAGLRLLHDGVGDVKPWGLIF